MISFMDLVHLPKKPVYIRSSAHLDNHRKKKTFGQMYFRASVHSGKYFSVNCLIRANVRSDTCPFGQVFIRASVHSGKCPFG